MAPTKVRKTKRKWYPILAPKVFNSQVIGETFVYDPELLSDKHITVNLMTLTGNPKKQSMNVSFKVINVVEGKAHTKTTGMKMQPSSLKRLSRRGRSKISDSFLAKTSKDEIVRVKPIIMTRTIAEGSAQTMIRSRIKDLCREILRTNSFESVLNDIVNMRVQKFLKEEIGTVYPVRSIDIRAMHYEGNFEEVDEAATEVKYPASSKKPKVEEPSAMQSLKDELTGALAQETPAPLVEQEAVAKEPAKAEEEPEEKKPKE